MYVEIDGATYRATGNELPFLVFAPAQEPRPDGFAAEPDGAWTRLVDKSEFQRAYVVRTTARWRDWTVRVNRVEDGIAHWRYYGDGLPADDSRVSRVGLFEWLGRTPVEELDDVVETVDEMAL